MPGRSHVDVDIQEGVIPLAHWEATPMFHELLSPLASAALASDCTSAFRFCQPIQPVADNLFLSFIVGLIPIAVVLVLLGVVRRPAWQAALAGLIVALIFAIFIWGMPVDLAATSTLDGFAFALLPVMWIVFNAMWLYNITVRTGKFDLFRRWMIHNVPPDKRILMLIIAFSFGALLEGIAGFGTPVAIASALLIALGFPVLDALVLTLIFNTAPVAFGALGTPITTLAGVTHLPVGALGAQVGRQLPIMALILPFYALIVFSGLRGLRSAWPAALVAGGSFALTQFFVSNFIGPELPDVLASLVSLLCVIAFVQVWKPRDIEQYRAQFGGEQMGTTNSTAIGERGVPAPVAAPGSPGARDDGKPTPGQAVLAWLPWVIISAVVIVWIFAKVPNVAASTVHWPNLDGLIFRTAYGDKYAATYALQPFGTGTAILAAVLITWLVLGANPRVLFGALADSWRQLRFAILTVVLIVGVAFLYNYSGMVYTLGLALASVGSVFPFFSVFIGWIACFLSGSDTSSNALFGNLQVVAARKLNLSQVLMAATNSSGAVTGKMISPQNVATGVSTTGLTGKEGLVIRRTFAHSLVLASILGIIVLLQQYAFPGLIATGLLGR
jgi:lactate permease